MSGTRHVSVTSGSTNAGVAVATQGRWLFSAADAYFYHNELDLARPTCTPGLRFYQWMMQEDSRLRRHNQKALRDLAREQGDAVTIFCAHDTAEFASLAGHPAAEPVKPRLPTIHA